MLQKGYVHVYTGNGKGKTTAMFGLALRACGLGLRVYIGQFIKSIEYSEVKAIRKNLPNVTVELYGVGCFIDREASQEDITAARNGLQRATQIVLSGEYDLVMLDEVNVALFYRMLRVDDVLELIGKKPTNVEMVLTGRGAPKELVAVADVVSDISEIKHYYAKGVLARDGIER